MTGLLTQPQLVTAAAADVAEIRWAIGAATSAAAGPTTGLAAAAQDEVSAVTTELFGGYAQEYQAVLKQAVAFHEEFAAKPLERHRVPPDCGPRWPPEPPPAPRSRREPRTLKPVRPHGIPT